MTSVAIVIPAFDAARHLPEVLDAARQAAEAAGGDAEIVVVDAGSSDDSAEVAERHGARVLRLPERAGPAEARNRGVAAVDAEVVLFLDSDCVPHRDAVRRVRAAFAADPDLVSLSGSYDAEPRDRGFFSRYMNLRHHATHQVARRESATFWAGCGAVRRSAISEVGGFDAARYPRPAIEDIELGLRLAEVGGTRLDPDLQVKHLKRWTGRSVITTDVFCRAVPWSRLLLERGGLPDDLNLRLGQRLAALLAPVALLAVPALLGTLVAGVWWLALAAGAVILASVMLSANLVRAFARAAGLIFAAGGWLFHQVHLIYSAATWGVLWLLNVRRNGSRR